MSSDHLGEPLEGLESAVAGPVFTDARRILNAREGEILLGNFLLVRIGYESVKLRFVGFPRPLGCHCLFL